MDTVIFEETAESMLKKTFFVVEATQFEQFALWRDYSNASNSSHLPESKRLAWDDMNHGWLVTVGVIGDMPCCITASFSKLNGHIVMFWYQCSQVTDSVQVEKWIADRFTGRWEGNLRPATTDATNFHLCVNAIHNLTPSKSTTYKQFNTAQYV